MDKRGEQPSRVWNWLVSAVKLVPQSEHTNSSIPVWLKITKSLSRVALAMEQVLRSHQSYDGCLICLSLIGPDLA